tara:strand:- start:119 stop:367 length:249 start_codon:yes stop_codon:yes gene_type:complete
MAKEDKDFLKTVQEDQKMLDLGLKMSRAAKKERLEDELVRLRGDVGNLEVQVSEYQQIVAELTEKLQRYEDKYGSVFVKSKR